MTSASCPPPTQSLWNAGSINAQIQICFSLHPHARKRKFNSTHHHVSHLLRLQHLGRQILPIPVAEEVNTGLLALHARQSLNPLADMHVAVQRLEEANGSITNISAVMLAHNGLNGFGGLIGVIEGNGGDVMVQDVGFDDAVEELTTNEAEFAVNGGGGTTGVGPARRGVVREGGIGVLQEGDCD